MLRSVALPRKPTAQFLWASRNTGHHLLWSEVIVPTQKGRLRHKDAGAFGDQMQAIGELIAPQSNGCWLWLGPTNPAGYGPYRTVYDVLRGGPGRGKILHHTCQVKACCNPDHLEPMTHAEHQALHAELRKARA